MLYRFLAGLALRNLIGIRCKNKIEKKIIEKCYGSFNNKLQPIQNKVSCEHTWTEIIIKKKKTTMNRRFCRFLFNSALNSTQFN